MVPLLLTMPTLPEPETLTLAAPGVGAWLAAPMDGLAAGSALGMKWLAIAHAAPMALTIAATA